jgi:hypothetical protein
MTMGFAPYSLVVLNTIRKLYSHEKPEEAKPCFAVSIGISVY